MEELLRKVEKRITGQITGEQIGLAILGTTGAFGIWSAMNPSLFTISKFAEPMDVSTVKKGMNTALAAVLALGLGIGLIYKKEGIVPALATVSTGVGMWLLSNSALIRPAQAQPEAQAVAMF